MTEPIISQAIRYVIEKIAKQPGMLTEGERATLHALTCPPDANCCCTLRLPIDLPEPERARIHALTRKVTMSDEELEMLECQSWTTPSRLLEAFKDLRDRYEERGKYAPIASSPPEFPSDRCRICGWPLASSMETGCVPGNCSQRPTPAIRADAGYAPLPASDTPDAEPRE